MNKKPWLAALLNFFFMGLGTLYIGKRALFGLGLTVAAVIFTYVELQLKGVDMRLYQFMFGATLIANIFFAWDGYKEAQSTTSATSPAA